MANDMRSLFAATVAAFLALPGAAAASHIIFFGIDSAQIDAAGMNAIEAAAAEYPTEGSTAVSVIGHTDATAPPEDDRALSERRANAVAAVPVAPGVPSGRITTAGRGWSERAMPTGDGVSEAAKRRALITVDLPAAPTPVAAPVAQPVFASRTVGLGPYIGFNDEGFDESIHVGAHLVGSDLLNPDIAFEAEQALFRSFGSRDEGIGSRTAIGADDTFADYGLGDGILPYVGPNAGHLTIDGSGTGGFFAGSEIGREVLRFSVKAACDIVEDRDTGDGVPSLTPGCSLSFRARRSALRAGAGSLRRRRFRESTEPVRGRRPRVRGGRTRGHDDRETHDPRRPRDHRRRRLGAVRDPRGGCQRHGLGPAAP
jgi:hypothetical protein